MKKDNSILKMFLALLLILSGGSLGYMLIEQNWTFLDSLYMTIITITTIGYGEIHELSPQGRMFTILIIFVGIGLAAAVVTRLGQMIITSGINDFYGKRKMNERLKKLNNHYLICGYGRIGSAIAMKLYDAQLDFVIVERDQEKAARAKSRSFPVLLGDASHDATLLAAGIARAAGTVLCIKDDSTNVNIALAARELNEKQNIIVRGTDPSIEYRLIRAGADTVVYPMKMGGEQIARLIAQEYQTDYEDSTLGSASVLGYQLQVFKNMEQDKTVQELLNSRQAIRPVAIRRKDGSMSHNPKPDTLVKKEESLLLLVNDDRKSRKVKDITILEWKDELATGIAQIDDEHRNLLKYAGDFQTSVTEGHSKEAVIKVFDLLLSYTESHFKHEENLMAQHNYPGWDDHHQLHVELTKQVLELNRDRRYIFSDTVWDFLDHWLKDHILDADFEFAEYLKQQNINAEARRQ